MRERVTPSGPSSRFKKSAVSKVTSVPPIEPSPGKPSLAVLPLANLSGDPRWERFADGITEDLITDLARDPDLRVIARNSTFVYKGKATDVRQVGKELGVKGKPLFMGLRLASTGRLEGLELPIYLALLGKQRVTERLSRMIALKETAVPQG